MMITKGFLPFVLAIALVGLLPAPSHASIFAIDDVTGHHATAEFTLDASGHLVLKLTNTSTADVQNASQVLTGLFFDINGDPALAALTATTCSNCIVNHTDPDPTNVAGEWAFLHKTDLAFGANYGVSAVGLDLFGEKNLIGPKLLDPGTPGPIDFGITSKGDNPATGNGSIAGVPLIQNFVVFTFAASAGFDLRSIDGDHLTWQYGTSLAEAVPEPGTLALFGTGLLSMIAVRRRRTA